PNMDYTVTLAAGIADLFGFQTTQVNSVSFLTAPDTTLVSNIVSPLDSAQAAVVSVPANSLSAGAFVVPRVQFLNPTGFLSRAGGPSSDGPRGVAAKKILLTHT